jgi:hypothetical protein
MLTSDERVGSCLKGPKTIADDENGGTETSKGLCFDSGNGNQGTDGVETEPPDEYSLVGVVS